MRIEARYLQPGDLVIDAGVTAEVVHTRLAEPGVYVTYRNRSSMHVPRIVPPTMIINTDVSEEDLTMRMLAT